MKANNQITEDLREAVKRQIEEVNEAYDCGLITTIMKRNEIYCLNNMLK